MDATEVIDKMIKNLEPIVEPDELPTIKECCLQAKDKLQQYLDKLHPPEEVLEDKAEEFVETHFSGLSDEVKQQMKETYIKDYYGEASMAKVMGISEESLNTIYTLAYNSYNHGKYAEVKKYFELLVFLDDKDPSFRFGYAATLHMMKDYELARDEYLSCISINSKNPLPWFHLADCCINLKEWKLAIYALNAVLEYTKGDSDYSKIVDKSKLLKDVAKQKLDQMVMEAKESAPVSE